MTTDSLGNFTVIFKKFLKMATAISKNTFFPEHLQWLLQQILKIKPSILKIKIEEAGKLQMEFTV